MTFRVDGVNFEDIVLPLRIYKARGLSRADVLSFFSAQENRRLVIEQFDELEALSLTEALKLTAIEHRMVALRSFDKDVVLVDPEAENLDRFAILNLVPNAVRREAMMRSPKFSRGLWGSDR